MFDENPCRHNPLEIFQVDRMETSIRRIRERIRDTRDIWNFNDHKITAPDGSEFLIDEARLNDFEARLNDPIRRLQDEQFVHQRRLFNEDAAMSEALREFRDSATTAHAPAIAETLLSVLNPLLRMRESELPDDLPWPAPPAAFEIEREPLERSILRDF